MAKNRVLCLFAASLVGAGCGEADREPDNNASSDRVETLTRDMDTQIAHAAEINYSRIHVDMLSRTGELLFSVDIHPGAPEEDTVAWSLPADAAMSSADGVTSGALAVPLEQLPDLEGAIDIAAFVQAKVIGGMKGQDYDNWGCDLPFTRVASCGRKGACCDTHDACFARHRCSGSSWWNPLASFACKACNAAVVACIGSAFYFPGPSVCCARRNCGQPR